MSADYGDQAEEHRRRRELEIQQARAEQQQARAFDARYQRRLEVALQEDDIPILSSFVREWEAAQGIDFPAWRVRSAFGSVAHRLATTRDERHTEEALKLSVDGEGSRPVRFGIPFGARRAAYIAGLLAYAQTPETLYTLLDRYADTPVYTETIACVVQESLFRGVGVAGHPSVERLWQRLQRDRHPLASLPLTLLPEEEAEEESEALPNSASNTERRAVDITTDQDRDRITAAVANWVEESNGRVAARVARLEPPASSAEDVTPALLGTLGPEFDRDAEPDQPAGRSIFQVTLSEAFAYLFSAARNGGAYNYGLGAAYGRHETWLSVAGLCGAEPDADFETVARSAAQSDWLCFDTAGGWFDSVRVWEIGLVALRPGGATLAALAATDTD